jgi:hypothetical protein
MNADGTLFDVFAQEGEFPDDPVTLVPVARNTDPETSHAAAATVDRRGQMALLLRQYADRGPLTDLDAARAAGLHEEAGHKRGSDLRNAGLIAPTGETVVGPSGRRQRLCAITDDGRAALR